MINDSLLLAAIPAELAGLAHKPPPGWRVNYTGIGTIAAAIATTKYLTTMLPNKVIFVGTCGAYDQRLAIGDILVASHALSISLDIIDGRIYRPKPEVYHWPATLEFKSTLPFATFTVAVTPGITKTSCGAGQLAALAAAEHLELASVFAACHAANVPCGAMLTVANKVGPQAHSQWCLNHQRVSQNLIKQLMISGVLNSY